MVVKLKAILASILELFKPKIKTSASTIIIVQNGDNSNANVYFNMK